MTEKIECLLCKKPCAFPKDYNITYDCPNCGAKYWIVGQDDLYTVHSEVTELLGTEEYETAMDGEFDILTDEGQPEEEGERMALVFARAKQ